MYALVNVALVCLAVQEVATDCADGFIKYESSCYRFFHNVFTWPEAASFCSTFDTHLVYLETEAEFGFIKARASEYGGVGFWTGATDAITENEWIFNETGERLTLTTDWAPGEPDPTLGRDCLGMWGKYNYTLSAWDCRQLLKPICEIEPSENGIDIIG